MNEIDYSTYESTIKNIRKSLESWEHYNLDPKVDKLGFGWNKDSRFTTFKIELAFTNWVGYYGSSSCSTCFYVGNEELFKQAFIKVMDKKALELFALVADELEQSSSKAKVEEVAKLQARLKKLCPSGNKE